MYKQQVKMNKEDVHVAKSLICQGHSQVEVARAVGVSASHMSRICAGDVHRDVPWPDPEIGERLMRDRREVISYKPLGDSRPDLASLALPPIARDKLTQISADNIRETQQMTEREALDQAIEKDKFRKEIRRRIERKIAELDEEEEKKFRAEMTAPREGGPDQNDPAVMPTAWEVKFLPWEEVQERGKGINLVEVADEEGDEITKRAIGIVFFKMPEEEWEGDQALQVIASITKQLRGTKK